MFSLSLILETWLILDYPLDSPLCVSGFSSQAPQCACWQSEVVSWPSIALARMHVSIFNFLRANIPINTYFVQR